MKKVGGLTDDFRQEKGVKVKRRIRRDGIPEGNIFGPTSDNIRLDA